MAQLDIYCDVRKNNLKFSSPQPSAENKGKPLEYICQFILHNKTISGVSFYCLQLGAEEMKLLEQQYRNTVLYIPGKTFELMNFNFDDEQNLERLSGLVKSLSRLQKEGELFKACVEIQESYTRKVEDNGSLRYQLVVAQKYSNGIKLDRLLEISSTSRQMRKMISKSITMPLLVNLWQQLRDFNSINLSNLGIKTNHISILDSIVNQLPSDDPEMRCQ